MLGDNIAHAVLRTSASRDGSNNAPMDSTASIDDTVGLHGVRPPSFYWEEGSDGEKDPIVNSNMTGVVVEPYNMPKNRSQAYYDEEVDIDGLGFDSDNSTDDLEKLDRKFRHCSYNNRTSQSGTVSRTGGFRMPEAGDLKSDAAEEVVEFRNQRLAMKTISKSLAVPTQHGAPDDYEWSGGEGESVTVGRIEENALKVGNGRLTDGREPTSAPLGGKKTIPVSFRTRRTIYIRDYEFDSPHVAIFVDTPLEFRLSKDVPLHAEHMLVGHSGADGEQCFESPLLQVSYWMCVSVLYICWI